MSDTSADRARPVGINHVALEVGDIDAALEFYGAIFEFELRSRSESSAFIDMGDQFIALAEDDDATADRDDHRHFGLVVDDPSIVEDRLESLDADRLSTSRLDFHDPWGNRVQVVGYEDIQFTKADHILHAMDLSHLEKTESAIEELAEKGMAPE